MFSLLSRYLRAAQSQRRINSIALDCINGLLQMDNDGELSFEIIRSISKTAGSFDFNIPSELIGCLQFAKLGVHADEAAEIRKKAKAEKKKVELFSFTSYIFEYYYECNFLCG